MRRIDDGHVPRPPPFRVLAAPDSNFLSPPNAPPPPSRAPEPYKVAPPSTTFSRAHRRSSFVIIADSRPTTPESASPTLATGRVSPFRGRGFKGPPPKSRSRPQSPDPSDARRRGRSERRVSVSQQSSPRRSLIPQPTRQRSTSLTKPSDGPSSPKIGRRVDSRTRLNISESKSRLNSYSNNNSITNLATRRQSAKTSKVLSPIQGTPTKPEKSQLTRRDRSKETAKISPAKTPRLSRVPSRNTPNARKSVKEKNSSSDKTTSRDRLMSPSKIPLKSNRNGTSSLNPARFITISNQPGDKNGRGNVDRIFKDISDDNEQTKESTQRNKGKQSEDSSKESASDKNSSGADSKSAELDLINLLKQSSGATGTSSVVNTTATTAVQPLHIDANAVLVERDLSEKKNMSEKMKNQSESSNGKSFNPSAPSSDSSASKSLQNSQSINDDQRSPNPQTSSKSSKPGSNYTRTRVPGDSRNDSPVPTDSVSGHSKNNSISQSVKNFNKINGTSNGTGSATLRSKNQNVSSNQTSKQTKTIEQKVSEDLSSVQTMPSNLTKASEVEAEKGSTKVTSNMETQRTVSSGNMTVKTMEVKVAPRSSNEGESKTTATTMTTNSTSVSQVTTTSKANNVSGNNTTGAMNDLPNVNSAKTGARNDNRGSNVSLKSSAGMSVDSIESVRSTDTGVSVNTVRGVSSPREKTGMHVVKRAQEIETLSGNVVHLEQNGEPAVLAAANGVGERVPERLLTRWKRSLNRYCGCCPKMRCLACRTDPKGLAWPGTHGKKSKTTTVPKRIGNEPAPQPAADAVRENAPSGCWSKLKNRCRCNRLKEMKCCSKRSRVAPAEVTPCCPPERRFGAICRRLFDRCKCKRAEVERRKSIRAKHSLTSVAPPPLSEEPKSKIPDVLVEHNSLMRGAIPCLPVPLAWFCLVWNILLPGSGTVWSGIFNLCTGQPRFSQVAGLKSRLGAFVVNLVVGVGQLFTVLFCLVGWGWSIWWGVTLVRLARKYKRFKASEAATNDPEARGGEPTALPPGVPSQALRGIERMR